MLKRKSFYAVLLVLATLSIVGAVWLANGDSASQQDATQQQQTIDALVNERFAQTAQAATQGAPEQTAAAEATLQAQLDQGLTATVDFQATVDAQFYQALAATAHAQLATAAAERGVELITAQNAVQIGMLATLDGHKNVVRSVAFSPDGRLIASAGEDGRVQVWDAVTGDNVRTIDTDTDRTFCAVFSPGGTLIASGGDDGRVRLWEVASGEGVAVLERHSGNVVGVRFSPDGRLLASGGADGTVRIWDLSTGETLHVLEGHEGVVSDVVYSPDGRLLVTAGEDATLRLWDTETYQLVSVLTGHTARIDRVTFSPDGRYLLSGSRDKTAHVWTVETGEIRGVLEGHTDGVAGVAFSPDGLLIAIGSRDKTISLWDFASLTRLTVFQAADAKGIESVAFSPDGTLIVSGGRSNKVRLWQVGAVETVVVVEEPTPNPTRPPDSAAPTRTPGDTVAPTPRPEGFPTDVVAKVQGAEQVFEHGRMFWIRHNGQIWVMVNDPDLPEGGAGDWLCYFDTFEEGEPESDPNMVPPEGLYQPLRGFGKLWRNSQDLQNALGWATTPEFDLTSTYTYIAGGTMDNGQYVPGPGEHRLTTLYSESISFYEQGIRGDCLGGTWGLTPP